MRDLTQCRADIDRVDNAILELIKERLGIAVDIAQNKLNAGRPIVDKEREQAKLAALCSKAEAIGIPPSMVSKLFRKIMDDTVSYEQTFVMQQCNDKSLERNTAIAYLGKTPGTYSHLAAMRFLQDFGGSKAFHGFSAFEEVISAVESGQCEYGVLPIENSSSGGINDVLDLLQLTKASIVGEVFYQIKHSVLALPGVSLSDIKTIYSHPQPITQCSRWLKSELPDVSVVYTNSTSEAMQLVSQKGDKTCAAIACEDSAELYHLTPLASDLANNKRNFTRFIVISMTPVKVPAPLKAKTSLLFTTKKYTPGSLIAVLNEFSSRGLNLTKLNSRPREFAEAETWEEIFLADIEANLDTALMQEIIEHLKDLTGYLKILGCYPNQEHTK